jgi:hypothetical protein
MQDIKLAPKPPEAKLSALYVLWSWHNFLSIAAAARDRRKKIIAFFTPYDFLSVKNMF